MIPAADSEIPGSRPIPTATQNKYDAWKRWASVWNSVHYISGAGAAALSATMAANAKAKPQFLSENQTLWCAVATAVCSFVLTLNPQKTAGGFVAAYRHLEKAIIRYRNSQTPNLDDLSQAEREGVDKLL